MSMYILPPDTAASVEAKGILARDERVTPHVVQLRAKSRNLGFHYIATAEDEGKTKVLIGFLPAGRNRVIFEQSCISGNIAVAAALQIGPYITAGPSSVNVPQHNVTAALGATAGEVTYMAGLKYYEGSQVAGDQEKSLPGWGLKYVAAEDIPIIVTVAAITAGNEIWGNIVYGQE